ncbi:MAG TPA: sterol desaturase family protein [Verrucomicrobiae bacterium]|nr:sterol desaturase family protein [Verrucomicrobiae bacterium]
MNQLHTILNASADALKQGIIALSIGLIVFTIMERMFVARIPKKSWRATFLDLQYAFLSMLYPPFIYFILSALFAYLSLRFYGTFHNPELAWPVFAGELMAALFVRDCLIYLRHRIFHTRFVWAFHSIHHSSEEVSWISAARFHPAENLIEATGEILLFIGCQVIGVDPMVLSTMALIVGFYNFFIHSNLPWTFGPLRYVFVSPVLHRWHHSDAPEAMDKNFAAMFSCIDVVLGTFYMPKNTMPETTGLSAGEKAGHPRTFTGQLLHPFKKR